MTLNALGFDSWFEEHAAGLRLEGCGFARVTAVDRGAYRITDAARDIPAELSGKLAFQTDSPADRPCVGDWVTAQYCNEDTTAIIHRVFPRKTFLRRRAPGGKAGFQMIAANVDTAFLVQSCHTDFNPNRLDRYLTMAADGHVEPVVLLTKTDMITREALDRMLAIVHSATRARVIALSSVTGIGFDAFQRALSPGRTFCLLGSSGVGKTTLMNRLSGRETFATQAVSGTGEGVHTTARRQLIVLSHGALVIDTPGMRELGLLDADEGLDDSFEAVAAFAAHCRYADCSHEHEPGCAVRAAVANGALSRDRYSSYIKLKKESAYDALSALDKRRKDKAFGRFMKSVKKRMQGG